MQSTKYYLLMVLLGFSSLAPAASEGFRIEYALDPAAAKIGPDVDLAQLKIRVRTADNSKPAAARLRIKLDAPPKQALTSTDFPIVEGTRLMDARAVVLDGEHRIYYMFPIRGEYQMQVEARPIKGDAKPVVRSFRFTLRENSNETRNLAVFLAGLLAFGLVAGGMLGRGALANIKRD